MSVVFGANHAERLLDTAGRQKTLLEEGQHLHGQPRNSRILLEVPRPGLPILQTSRHYEASAVLSGTVQYASEGVIGGAEY